MTAQRREQFAKEKTALKFYLLGKGYHQALKALAFAERYHSGLRKDKETPEFHHQVRIALAVTQLKSVLNEELAVTAALLHDVQEDHQISSDTLRAEFGDEVAGVVWKLTKKYLAEQCFHSNEAYIDNVSIDATASVVKGCDRLDNLRSMVGVFTPQKMLSYSAEVEDLFLPMLKKASRLFPEQTHAYHAIIQSMKADIAYIKPLALLMLETLPNAWPPGARPPLA